MTHIVDARIEWDDDRFVAAHAPGVACLHHGMDDAGQEVPEEWFDVAVGWAVPAIADGGVVLTHCHMGINRGPSLGFAVLLALGWAPVEAMAAIRAARPIAYAAYAEDALRWHHWRSAVGPRRRAAEVAELDAWRRENPMDVRRAIRAAAGGVA
ncbi:hypothetical protein [Cellulomonas flavigena]|uniref:hypothetical protein n=1 Tax=Cellulomonas flavigena TaxID=1711 RepID=UPI001651540C|nr:hypothetical protein [Cellulomonas flavigena]